VFLGGAARLLSLGIAGAPSPGHIGGLFMELVAVPLLVLWQARLAKGSFESGQASMTPARTG